MALKVKIDKERQYLALLYSIILAKDVQIPIGKEWEDVVELLPGKCSINTARDRFRLFKKWANDKQLMDEVYEPVSENEDEDEPKVSATKSLVGKKTAVKKSGAVTTAKRTPLKKTKAVVNEREEDDEIPAKGNAIITSQTESEADTSDDETAADSPPSPTSAPSRKKAKITVVLKRSLITASKAMTPKTPAKNSRKSVAAAAQSDDDDDEDNGDNGDELPELKTLPTLRPSTRASRASSVSTTSKATKTDKSNKGKKMAMDAKTGDDQGSDAEDAEKFPTPSIFGKGKTGFSPINNGSQ